MKSRFKEQGSALHIAIVVILVVLVIGVLGWVFWHNYVNKTVTTSEVSEDVYKDWKKYTFSDTGTTFRYPSEWNVSYFPVSEADNRQAASLLLTYDQDTVLPSGVSDSLWPTIDIYNPATEPVPTFGDWEVIYTEKLSNSLKLVCSYHDGEELPGTKPIQRLVIDLVGEGFNEQASEGSSTLVAVGDNKLIISGGNIGYDDGSFPLATAKKLCESPKSGDYTTKVIQWLKSIEL